MFARITHYKMNPGSREAATNLLNSLRDQIMGMQGMHHFVNVMREDGTGYILSVVESEASSNANADKVAKLWSNFAGYLEAPPKAEGYDVIANWSN